MIIWLKSLYMYIWIHVWNHFCKYVSDIMIGIVFGIIVHIILNSCFEIVFKPLRDTKCQFVALCLKSTYQLWAHFEILCGIDWTISKQIHRSPSRSWRNLRELRGQSTVNSKKRSNNSVDVFEHFVDSTLNLGASYRPRKKITPSPRRLPQRSQFELCCWKRPSVFFEIMWIHVRIYSWIRSWNHCLKPFSR